MSAIIIPIRKAYFAAEKEGFDPREIRDREGRISIPEAPAAKEPDRPYAEEPGMAESGEDFDLQ